MNYFSTYLVKVTMTELTGLKELFDCFVDALSKRVDVADKESESVSAVYNEFSSCLLYTSPSPRDATLSRMPSSA